MVSAVIDGTEKDKISSKSLYWIDWLFRIRCARTGDLGYLICFKAFFSLKADTNLIFFQERFIFFHMCATCPDLREQ